MDETLRQVVKERSQGRCEAEVLVGDVWMRCTAQATDIHHLLPRSRGGNVLDQYGETCHLLHLCRRDHGVAHARQSADGMMIDGSVVWNRDRTKPLYRGTDPELTRKYGHTSG